MTFPAHNLNNAAVPWGRRLENSVSSQARELEGFEGALSSDNRSRAGQFGVLGRQSERIREQALEVSARSTIFRELGSYTNSFTVPGGSLSNPGPVVSRERFVTIEVPPAPDGYGRVPYLFVSGEAYVNNPSINFSSGVWVNFLGRQSALAAPLQSSAPPNWVQAFNFELVASRGLQSFQMRVYSEAGYNSGGSVSLATGVQNLRLVVSYGAK